jgi:polyisoprenoid-binding protein YceI
MAADPQTATSPTRRGPRRPLLLGAVLAVLALAGLLIWYLGRDAPAAVNTEAAIEAATTAPGSEDDDTASADDEEPDTDTADAGAADDDPDDAGVPAGDDTLPADWRIVTDAVAYDLDAGTGTFVGFRIAEELTTVGDTEAIGRTPAVEGSVSLEGTTLVAASIIADLTALTTDIRQRDGATQRALNTTTNPTTTFTLTEPVDLGTDPVVGEPISVEATGELTLNGVTQPVTATLDAVLLDGAAGLLVAGSFPLTLADHDLVAPSAPVVVSVADTATVELQLYLDPA